MLSCRSDTIGATILDGLEWSDRLRIFSLELPSGQAVSERVSELIGDKAFDCVLHLIGMWIV